MEIQGSAKFKEGGVEVVKSTVNSSQPKGIDSINNFFFLKKKTHAKKSKYKKMTLLKMKVIF